LAKAKSRGYRRSLAFTKKKGSKGRVYYMNELPGTFWDAALKKAKREHRSMRLVLLTLVKEWMERDDQTTRDTARMVDRRGSGGVLPVQRDDVLHAGQDRQDQDGTGDGDAATAIPQGVDRSVAGAEYQEPQGGGVEGDR
jgi:hypothetical protein